MLKKTVTNDRSAPIVGNNKRSNGSAPAASLSSGPSSNGGFRNGSAPAPTGRLPGIGGLFADGMPKLKKTSGGVNTGRMTTTSGKKMLLPWHVILSRMILKDVVVLACHLSRISRQVNSVPRSALEFMH